MNITTWTLTIASRVRQVNTVNTLPTDPPSNYSSIPSINQSSQPIITMASNVSGHHNYVIYLLAITALVVALLTSLDIDFSSAASVIRRIFQWLKVGSRFFKAKKSQG
ncbi:MAG: putative manganese transporter [Desulfurococcales archaeon]|nr:putative manganese transporter [Desulfurococcales archaeon]